MTIEEQHTMLAIQALARKVDSFTLRDYFAGQALSGIMSNAKNDFSDNSLENIAKICYAYADALVEYRK